MKNKASLFTALASAVAIAAMAIEPQELILPKNHQSARHENTATADEKSLEHLRLTERDYQEVARELGVEVAAIKAVVEIEAGRAHEGFFKVGKPIINFDLSMFRQFARRNGVNLSRYTGSHSTVFNRPNLRRYGSQQAAQHARLEQARTIDEKTAFQGTFWGMFQIGGFNWKICGCKDIYEFVERMSRSERDQLDLFAKLIKATGLDKALRQRNWARFARTYNGPGYAARGYHTKMASAYARHSRKSKPGTPSKEQTEATEVEETQEVKE